MLTDQHKRAWLFLIAAIVTISLLVGYNLTRVDTFDPEDTLLLGQYCSIDCKYLTTFDQNETKN